MLERKKSYESVEDDDHKLDSQTDLFLSNDDRENVHKSPTMLDKSADEA